MIQILNNVSFLALAALLLYPALRSRALQRRGWRRSLVVGALMGATASMVILQPLLIEGDSVVDGRAGPLVFAGFLGGPLGGAIAWLFALLARAQLGGALFAVSAFGMALYTVFGFVYCWFTRRSRVRALEWRDVGALAVGTIAVVLVQILVIRPRDEALDLLRESIQPILVANFASVFIVGLLLRYVLAYVERERLLERAQERLELACESAGLGIWDWNLRTNEVVWDERLSQLHGIGDDGFQGQPTQWLRGVFPQDRRRLARDMRRLVHGERQLDTEARVVTREGEVRYIKTNGVVVHGDDGRPLRVVGVNQDLSSLRRVEQDAREIGWRFEDLANSIPGVILTYVEDPDGGLGTVVYISPSCEELFELTADQIIADPRSVPADEDLERRAEMRRTLRAARDTGSEWQFEWRIRTASGRVKWLQGRALPRKLRDGRWQWSVVVLDITEQVMVKEALEHSREIDFESRKMEVVGRLTGGVAHDFNNLLSVIVGVLSMLSADDVPDDLKESVADALAACDRGASLTQQLLAFGRQARLSPTTLDVRRVLARSQQLLERTLPERIEVISEWPDLPCPVFLDRTRLERVVLNLGLNARDAMPTGGTIWLRVEMAELSEERAAATGLGLAAGDYVRVTVADSGRGMSPEVQEKAFEPFFTTKEVNEGSGLGLAMVQGFVRQSEGAVRLESTPGEGTEIELYFPRAEGEVAVDEPDRRASSTEGGSEHVLLVEDDEGVRNVLSKQLRRLGYRLTVCADGEAGLSALDRHSDIAVLLTDVVMPGSLQGPQLAERVRQRLPGVGVVFMTGYARDSLAGEARNGDHVQLAKPFKLQQLDGALRQVLDRRGRTDSLAHPPD